MATVTGDVPKRPRQRHNLPASGADRRQGDRRASLGRCQHERRRHAPTDKVHVAEPLLLDPSAKRFRERLWEQLVPTLEYPTNSR